MRAVPPPFLAVRWSGALPAPAEKPKGQNSPPSACINRLPPEKPALRTASRPRPPPCSTASGRLNDLIHPSNPESETASQPSRPAHPPGRQPAARKRPAGGLRFRGGEQSGERGGVEGGRGVAGTGGQRGGERAWRRWAAVLRGRKVL